MSIKVQLQKIKNTSYSFATSNWNSTTWYAANVTNSTSRIDPIVVRIKKINWGK